MTEYRRLEAHEAVQCSGLTYPAYRHLLELQPVARLAEEAYPRIVQPIAIGAISEGAVVGLAVAEVRLEGPPSPELLSVYVVPEMRRAGIGAQLVASVEDAIAKAGQKSLSAVFMIGKPGVDYFKQIIARRGWSEPAVRMVSVRFAYDVLMNAPWMHEHGETQPEYEMFTWADLSADELEHMRKTNAERKWIADDLQPWDYMVKGFDAETSVGLRYKGEVVGWAINHRLDADILRHTCSFLRKDISGLGRIVVLYAATMHRARAAGYKRGIFVTPLHHRGMAAFARRRFGPWCEYVGVTEGATKTFQGSAV